MKPATSTAGSPSVHIVDDDPAVAEALSELFASAGIATRLYASAEQLIDACTPEMSGCLLLDVRLPGISGMELQARLAQSEATLPIIMMTAHGDIPMVRKALKAGAVEFLTKPFHDDELLQAVEQAFAKDQAQKSAREAIQRIRARWQTLSERERQVMELVCSGLLNKQIADRLFLSLVTVKLYRRQVMQKMQADSVADLVRMWEKLKAPG